MKSVNCEQHRPDARKSPRIDTGPARTSLRPRENGGQADRDDLTSDHVIGASDNAHDTYRTADRTSHDPPVSSIIQAYDSTGTPKNSLVLQSRSSKTHLITNAASNALTDGHAASPEQAFSLVVAPSRVLVPFLFAGLDENSADAAQPTTLALKCRSNVDYMLACGSRAIPNPLVTNDAGEHVANIDGLGDAASEPERKVREPATEYERCISCPGAYPESDVRV